MANVRFEPERRAETQSKDLELVLHVLQEAFAVIDDHDPDRNPARCMRQLRRLLDNTNVRAAMRRLAAEIPLTPDSEPRDQS
jgi:hypothetical protein